VPFGKGNPDDLTFPVEPTFAKQGIDFAQSAAMEIEAEHKRVQAPCTSPSSATLTCPTPHPSAPWDAVQAAVQAWLRDHQLPDQQATLRRERLAT
jgi:hypothetical protein